MLKNYLKIAFKVLLRRKFFTFISLFAISFTLVVLMMVTAFLDNIFGPYPPEVNLDRTLGVFHMRMESRVEENGNTTRIMAIASYPGYAFLDRYVRTLPNAERVSIFSEFHPVSSYLDGRKVAFYLKRTDAEFWKILQFEFLEGGPFTDEDDKNARFVAVINVATRKKFFGNESAIGQTIEADGQRFRVVGVVANIPLFRFTPFADIWVPIGTSKSNSYRSQMMGGFQALILAKSKGDFGIIKEEFASRLARVEFTGAERGSKMSGGADTFFEAISRHLLGDKMQESRPGQLLGILVSLMVLFMFLPTVNLVNINVSRIMERSSEIGIRKSFGASSQTLVGQFVVENIFLTFVGGILGLVLSFLILQFFNQTGWIPYAQFRFNYRVFLYALLLIFFFGLFSGIYPAWKMSRLHPVKALKGRAA